MTFYADYLSDLDETRSLESKETCGAEHNDRYISECYETPNVELEYMEYEYDKTCDVEHGEALNSEYECDGRYLAEHDERSLTEHETTCNPEYSYAYDDAFITEHDGTYVADYHEPYLAEHDETYASGRSNNRFLAENDTPPYSEYKYDETYDSDHEQTYPSSEEEEVNPPTFSPLSIRGTRTDRITLVLLPMDGWPDWDFVTYLVEAHWQRQRENNDAMDPDNSLGAILVFRLRSQMLIELVDNHRAHAFEYNGQLTWNYRSPEYQDALVAFCRHIYRDHRLQFNEQDTQPRFYATHRQRLRRSRESCV
ncbi:uncharacterized protein BO95DRAFT_495692 [Aspergillus brunneoviolaceus CBS 621.78]|uniref:Uncharacterized protein n=1 Tax=Aspergillus brunneoviolaceus CBS 621.78 TaxID=1450534 RepID=A0ACD1GAD8_9EURO|nr:hypothetical protein BO95DRAFT_495692 [Aspergillus brunneoviolaceus CBS 621.78]RAH46260.1 hypothetical protein BO95DRAFT_495692 [Aspergillus brunneoviolaceus CBS 621.78]